MFFSRCRKFLMIFLVMSSLSMMSTNLMAQQAGAAGDASLLADSMNDVAIVSGCGLGGAILGLSTLSFVEKPSEHLRSIVVGGALGIIVGVAVVAYLQATKTSELYEEQNSEGGASYNGYNMNRLALSSNSNWFGDSDHYFTKQNNFSNIPQIGFTHSF